MNNQKILWERVSQSYKAFSLALQDFLSPEVNRVDIMKKELLDQDRVTAVYLLRYLTQEELIQLFNELVYLSSFSHGSVEIIRQIILSLPRDWVISNIKQVAEPIIKNGGYDEYRRLLELYLKLDHNLTTNLALRAINQEDSDIKEAGEDFLALLSK
jgi:hypothetical protein